MEKEEIEQVNILKKLAESIVISNKKYDAIEVKKEEVDKIIESEVLNFEQKKEIFEKLKLLQLFGSEYLSYITAPSKQNAKRFCYSAKEILDVETEADFKTKMKKLDEVLDMCKNVAMHPYESTKNKVQQEIHQTGAYLKGGKF